MSMDEVMGALKAFERELEGLTSTMQSSVHALQGEHDRVSGLWNDSFSKDYHRRWSSFERGMSDYLSRDAPKYQSFLTAKIGQLGRYLGHG